MITKITTIEEFEQLFVETLLNNTNEVTKVTKHSTLSGISYGVAKVAQKVLKEIALVETHLFPENAYGSH